MVNIQAVDAYSRGGCSPVSCIVQAVEYGGGRKGCAPSRNPTDATNGKLPVTRHPHAERGDFSSLESLMQHSSPIIAT